MGCCGKKIRKAGNIIKGNVALLRGIKYEVTDARLRKCRECEWNTWMSAIEYAVWLAKHGIEVLVNFDQLEKLPMMPKYKQGKGRRGLYCRICKCFVPAKARVEDAECPKGFW